MSNKTYLRERFFPHLWCPGCGHGIVLSGLLRAVEQLGLSKNDIVMVSGIGCSARISGYVDFHTLHTIHGRALAFATGVKISRPELKLIVPMGDGDALAIGGNHFIHAARRNIDITAIVMNNRIYGMTGGQFSPLSGPGINASTAPYANIDPAFDVVELARAAGATFVARTTVYHAKQITDFIKQAIGAQGVRGRGNPDPVSDPFRPQEQGGQCGGHAQTLPGDHHPDRLQSQTGQSGPDRTGHIRSERSAGIL